VHRCVRAMRWGMVVLIAVILAACEGYTESMARTSSSQTMDGGRLTAHIGKANGSIVQDLETDASSIVTLDASVTLAVGKGTYKIELLGENEQVTLILEASAGQTVSGDGWMVTDGFGEASYRVTATEAEDVDYQIDYTFR
jgi:hypothetical protein